MALNSLFCFRDLDPQTAQPCWGSYWRGGWQCHSISMTVMVQCVMAENCVAATKLVILFFSVTGPPGWVSQLCQLDKMCFNSWSTDQLIIQSIIIRTTLNHNLRRFKEKKQLGQSVKNWKSLFVLPRFHLNCTSFSIFTLKDTLRDSSPWYWASLRDAYWC